jgi:hypothetical protein
MRWFIVVGFVLGVGLAQDGYEREECLQARWNAGYDLHSQAQCQSTLSAQQIEAYQEYTLTRMAALAAERGETYAPYEAWLAAQNSESVVSLENN